MTPEQIAPWPDFAGNPIKAGDTIRHPSGEQGTVLYWPHEQDPGSQWRVDYGGPNGVSRLSLQIGDKGQAIVIPQYSDHTG